LTGLNPGKGVTKEYLANVSRKSVSQAVIPWVVFLRMTANLPIIALRTISLV